MKIHKYKRYTTWVDDRFWPKTAIEFGLTHGVYDNKKEERVHIEGITSQEQAKLEADKLNDKLNNPFLY